MEKLEAHGFSESGLKVMHSYFFDRRQMIKRIVFYTSQKNILSDILQDLIVGPLTCNLFLSNVSFKMINSDYASYAGDSVPYETDETPEEVIHKHEKQAKELNMQFLLNETKTNLDKCHLFLNPFHNTDLFLYSLKTLGNLW